MPIVRTITASSGDTLEALAATHLGDRRRAKYLAQFNSLPPDTSLAAGQRLTIPFHIRHVASTRVTLASLAATFLFDRKQAHLLRDYNFLTSSTIEKGTSITIPMFSLRVRPSKLPAPDRESAARAKKRLAMQTLAAPAVRRALSAWKSGDFTEVKRLLAPIETDYLNADSAAEIGVLLGSAYVAFDDVDSALASFGKVLARRPKHHLDPYTFSPKIRRVWQQAAAAKTR